MGDRVTNEEAAEIMQRPENTNRARVDVHEGGDGFEAEWDGQKFSAGNMFALDSLLTEFGVPAPRNLFFIDGGVTS
jgi:hypothetical protein